MSVANNAGYASQNGGSGQPYMNGPKQNPLMQPSQIPAGQGYMLVPPASTAQQIPGKLPAQQTPEHKNYSYFHNAPPANTLQELGQSKRLPVSSQLVPMSQKMSSVYQHLLPPEKTVSPSSYSKVMPAATHLLPSLPDQQFSSLPHPSGSVVNHPQAAPQAGHVSPAALPAKTQTPSLLPATGFSAPTGVHSPLHTYKQPELTPPKSSMPLPTTFIPGKPLIGPPRPTGAPPPVQTANGPPLQAHVNASTRQDGGFDLTSTEDSLVSNSYDALEGGSYIATEQTHVPKMGRGVGYTYPTLQPGYQTTPAVPLSSQHCPPGPQQFPQVSLIASMGGLSLQPNQQHEGLRHVNLIQERKVLPSSPVTVPVPRLHPDSQKLNCSPEVLRCTLTNIPQTQSLLNKAKLPLGLLLHPFKDLSQLPVVTSSTIVRCRACRTYINPFVSFLDQRRWKCNLCYRVNDVPEEFMYNPVSRSYGEPHKRPEVQNATIELIAPSEYMLRPPQPAVYLFVLDVSHNAVETGYLNALCQSLLDNLNSLPGDSRTKIGFITFDSTIHFYSLQDGLSQPQMLIVSDVEDVFIPMPENLLVNLNESKELVQDLLRVLPQRFLKTMETQSALGPALQAAFKLMSPTGGRLSVFQTQLPSVGAGLLKSREDPNQRASAKEIQHLSPATDFYKKLALDCSGQQIAVDFFALSGQYSDLASLACISRYSSGCIYHYPSYHHEHNPTQVLKFQKDLKRYLTRKIGFEAVMRIRCTKGLSIHTFHGNFFVRSTDLLSLPNVNPDAGFAVQMSIEDNLTDLPVVSFQAALLYTSSKGERRIRVHTLCLPVVASLADVYAGADIQAVSGLLASMAVDRSVSSSLGDARDALVNAVIDSLSSYRSSVLSVQQPGLIAPFSMRLFPLYVLALLKQKAFRTGTSTRLDDRVFAMCQMKSQPLAYLMPMIHPNLYRIDNLTEEDSLHVDDKTVPQPPILQLAVENLSRDGAYLMDAGSVLYLYVGRNCGQLFLRNVLGISNYALIPQNMVELPDLDTPESVRTVAFIAWLREQRPFFPVLHVMRDDSPLKMSFLQNMVEDRTESALSYYEFLLHIQQQVNK
ncbi:protein transport protein Sec24A [Protopterus annectens]|uniref:protein transport protein Sec24A n=1 Tax=Protopterus annectens TaxID=7888 RepID=UPI001CF9AB42|nr:protein transport protein Sec24A [Protopterus annectens]